VPNFAENISKQFDKFTENSWAPQPLIQAAMLMQLRNLSNITFEICEQRIFIIVTNVLTQESVLDIVLLVYMSLTITRQPRNSVFIWRL